MDASAFAHQRARGKLRLSFKRRNTATVLDGLRQEWGLGDQQVTA